MKIAPEKGALSVKVVPEKGVQVKVASEKGALSVKVVPEKSVPWVKVAPKNLDEASKQLLVKTIG